MPPSEPRIFHIADQERWTLAETTGGYTPPGFETDQFIHCCTLEQMSGVLFRFFKDQDSILVLELETNRLMNQLRFENLENGAELFPHLYSSLPISDVKQVFHLRRNKNMEFDLSIL